MVASLAKLKDQVSREATLKLIVLIWRE